MYNNNKWFTFVELIIVTAIIGILTVIGFVSYVDFISGARDSQRTSDLAKISSALKVFQQKRWYFPDPGENFRITNNWYVVWYQGFLDTWVRLQTLDTLPNDPKIDQAYFYSITWNKQQFQLGTTLENDDTPVAFLEWNYSSVSKNVLPNIILAITATSDIEIHTGVWDGDQNRDRFIFHKQSNNLPYTFETGLPYSEWTSFDTLLSIAENNEYFWQNNDYRNCLEIYEERKYISDFTATGSTEEYQILTTTGALVNTQCNLVDDSYNDGL